MEQANLPSLDPDIRGKAALEESFRIVLSALELLGLDTADPNFARTPHRIAKAYVELFSGLRDTTIQIDQILTTSFPCGKDNMVVVTNIEAFSMCPHHLLPVIYNAHIAYIPSKEGMVLGLSKLPRVVELLAKRPLLQEKFTDDITTALMRIPGCQGAAAIVAGIHFCMKIRGVKQHKAGTVTSSMVGLFDSDSATRAEFLSLTQHST